MSREPVELVPPKHGLHDGDEFSRQPPLTTRLSKNMRTQQASTSRLRTAQRAGYAKYNPRTLLKNYLAFTEDFGHLRDHDEGTEPFPTNEGWFVQSTGAKAVTVTTDATLAPDESVKAQLIKQVVATGGQRSEWIQTFDVNNPPTDTRAKPGATFLRTAGDLMFSLYVKASDSTTSIIAIRQGLTAGLPRTQVIINWSGGVATLGTVTTDGPGAHNVGITDEGNGWYRVWVSLTWAVGSEVTGPHLRVFLIPNSADTAVKGIYAWGAQLEIVPSGVAEPTQYEAVLLKNSTLTKRKAAALVAVTHIQNKVSYKRVVPETASKSYETSSKQSPQDIALDRMGNRYVLEPQAVVKFSAKGDLVFTIPVPISDPAHVCQALHLDEVDQIYVGVTSGGESAKSKLFCFRQGPEVVGGQVRENSWHLLWEVETKKYVVAIKSREGVLYTAQDDPGTAKSELVVYENLDFAEPDIAFRRDLPYPTRNIAVKPSDGSIFSCHPTNATRGLDPTANGSDVNGPWPTAVGWTPENDFANWKSRVYSSHDADFVKGVGRPTVAEFKDADAVVEWIDLSGHERNFYHLTEGQDGFDANTKARFRLSPDEPALSAHREGTPPAIKLRAINGKPGVTFDGLFTMMRTARAVSLSAVGTDQNKTAWPMHENAKLTTFIVFRPNFADDIDQALGHNVGVVMGVMSKDIGNTQFLALVCNAQEQALTPANPGPIMVSTRGHVFLANASSGTVDPPVGTAGHPNSYLLESGSLVNFAVATIVCSPTTGESVFRINGTVVEPGYSSRAFGSLMRTTLGCPWANVRPRSGSRDAGDEEWNCGGSFDGEILAQMTYAEVLSTADIELHEGYFANRYGGQGRLDPAHPYKVTPGIGLLVPTNAPLSAGKADTNQLNHRSTILAKFAPGGELKWTVTDYSGVGFDLVVDSDGNVFSFGEYDTSESGDYLPVNRGRKGWVRKIIDNGDSASPDGIVADWCQNMVRSGVASASSVFSSPFWTATDVTVANDTTTDPFSNTQADTLTDGAAGGAGTLRHDYVTADLFDGADYTFSVYLKRNTNSVARILLAQVGGSGAKTQVDFNLSTRSLTPSLAGTGRRHSFNVEDVGNGWARIQVSLNFLSSDSGTFRIEITPDTTGSQLSCFAYGAFFERNVRASTFALETTQRKDSEPAAQLGTSYPRMAIDKFNNVFIPGAWPIPLASATTFGLFTARIYDKNLYLLNDIDIGRLSADTFRAGRAFAVNPEPPSYSNNNPGVIRNLLGCTQRFDNTYWSKTSLVVTPNTHVAPDGTATADTLDDTSATVSGSCIRDADLALLDAGEVYTFSVHLAPQDATTTRIVLEHIVGSTSTDLLITWNTGAKNLPVVTRTDTGGGVHTHEVQSAAMGFFRVSVSLTFDAAGVQLRCRINPDANASAQGAVTAWGAQLERGPQMTPYQRVNGRHPFPPVDSSQVVDPVALTDEITLVTASDDVESLSTAPVSSIHEFTLVSSGFTGLPARDTKLVSIVKGSAFVIDRAGVPQVMRGGSSCLDPEARYISGTSIFQRAIFTDGIRSVIYQPAVDGQMRPFVAKSGEIPTGVELWQSWRGRAVAARTQDDPHAWFMSAIEDVFDWDYFSPPLRSDKAVFSTTSRAGLAPDAINTIIPYDDQRIIFGCDHAIWYLPADPLSEMAQWQQISDITGIAFGNNSWCKDPSGLLYFFGSRGGLYRIGGETLKPESLTTETIERRLRDIDLEKFYVELFWNWREEGIHLFVIPYGSPETIVKQFFWGRRFNEWREDEFAAALMQPTSAVVIDGDLPQDRQLLLANGHLNVLAWSETSKTDDGLLIDSQELLGPYDVPGEREALWQDLMVLLSEDSDAARFELYAADSADALGSIRATGSLVPGRNSRKPVRVSGAKFWVLLGNNQVGQSWAFEQGTVWMSSAGRARVR